MRHPPRGLLFALLALLALPRAAAPVAAAPLRMRTLLLPLDYLDCAPRNTSVVGDCTQDLEKKELLAWDQALRAEVGSGADLVRCGRGDKGPPLRLPCQQGPVCLKDLPNACEPTASERLQVIGGSVRAARVGDKPLYHLRLWRAIVVRDKKEGPVLLFDEECRGCDEKQVQQRLVEAARQLLDPAQVSRDGFLHLGRSWDPLPRPGFCPSGELLIYRKPACQTGKGVQRKNSSKPRDQVLADAFKRLPSATVKILPVKADPECQGEVQIEDRFNASPDLRWLVIARQEKDGLKLEYWRRLTKDHSPEEWRPSVVLSTSDPAKVSALLANEVQPWVDEENLCARNPAQLSSEDLNPGKDPFTQQAPVAGGGGAGAGVKGGGNGSQPQPGQEGVTNILIPLTSDETRRRVVAGLLWGSTLAGAGVSLTLWGLDQGSTGDCVLPGSPGSPEQRFPHCRLRNAAVISTALTGVLLGVAFTSTVLDFVRVKPAESPPQKAKAPSP